MYKKIMVFGMVMLIFLCTPLPSFADGVSHHRYWLRYDIGNGQIRKISSIYPIILNTVEDSSNVSFNIKVNGSYVIEIEPINVDGSTGYPSNSSGSKSSYSVIAEGQYSKPFKLLSCNHNLYDDSGQLLFSDSSVIPVTSFDGRITLPANDGYKDNGTTFTFWHWYQLPTGVDSSDVKIDPYIDDSKDTYHSASVTLHQKIPNTSKWNLNINLTVREYGPHTYKVVFKQISTGKFLGTLTRTFESLEGFIDENGDGLDDRTGQPPYDPLEPPGDSLTPEWDGTILGFFKYIIDSVKYYVENIVSGINTTMGAIGKVPQIMGTILNFPEPLTALLIFGVTCTIILAIFRR